MFAAARIEDDLRRLLDGDPAVGALVVVYQAIVDASTHELVNMEALVRWRDADGAMIYPDTFLPAAERIGLGRQIDDLVLRQALLDLKNWPAGPDWTQAPERVSVNLGRTSLLSPTLEDDVLAACRDLDMPPTRLAVEITEHDQIPLDSHLTEELARLRAQGVRISLDDFGAGYAALGYLKRWPIDHLKVDRSLLPAARDQSGVGVDALALFRAVTRLALDLGLTVTVEGIETDADAELARSAGATWLQGYLFGRPAELGALSTARAGQVRSCSSHDVGRVSRNGVKPGGRRQARRS